MTLALLSTALVYAFILCCVVSAALQVIAWSRHALEGAPRSLKALWRPEGYFDPIGLRQMRVARTLLLVGGVAYVTYGGVIVAMTLLAQPSS
ncbi:MAG TPA: hypothetical protein VMN39_08090 [Longimicrobiaceae bacterium]|nr:hypothetical protein [Longimicrobiaceae bacterium]